MIIMPDEIVITHKGLAHLTEAILTASQDTMKLSPSDAQAFTNLNGDYIYALIRGVLSREIVKVNFGEKSQPSHVDP